MVVENEIVARLHAIEGLGQDSDDHRMGKSREQKKSEKNNSIALCLSSTNKAST